MAPSSLASVPRAAARGFRSSSIAQAVARRPLFSISARNAFFARPTAARRLFTTSSSMNRGIMPETSEPHGKDTTVPETPVTVNVAELTDAEYHELADQYMDVVVSKLEELAETREGFDVEYSAGVLTLNTPEHGTYVINKQPPNKQIWLSSPLSGPKRYDWAILGEGQAEKEGTGAGNWIYMRDGSTLGDIFLKELDVDFSFAPSTYGQ
ncbi:hypothetical protein VDGD_07667 [Verticillium dahliae]|nr:hypothetical protein VdG1_01002 [Verticillium dahliae VDG1]RBQ99225.1 hypothetical protein VDGD_07667 [Verticillium dahliae]